MSKYKRLMLIGREEISRQLSLGYSIRKIAKTLNRTPSTISREINRTVVYRKYYRAIFAQQHSNKINHKRKTRKLDTNVALRKFGLISRDTLGKSLKINTLQINWYRLQAASYRLQATGCKIQ